VRRPARRRLGSIGQGLIGGAILLFLIAPALVVVPLSFAGDAMTRFPPEQWSLDAYNNFFDSSAWIRATLFSLEMSLAVTIMAVLLGTATAYGLIRTTGFWSKVLTVLILVPIVVPPIIFALAAYGLLSDMGLLGTMAGFVIVNAVLAAPYAILTIRTGMAGIDPSLYRAASVLGARPLRILTRVGLPLLLPSLIAAGLFAFLVAFDEVVIAQFISGPFAVPLSKHMWDGILYRWDPAISAISTIQIALTVLILVVVGLMQKRRLD
jgi:putative spermidine/putrescine transport system permease protein